MEIQFTEKEELANSIIHGFGVLFGIICIPVLIALAVKSDTVVGVVGACIYGFSFLLVFTSSTLFHGFQQPYRKAILEKFDHISIYFLIAGTYTPFILLYLNNSTGIRMLVVLWSLAFMGIFFKALYIGKYENLAVVIYLLMGWIALTAGKTFFVSLPLPVFSLLALGGILYTVGVIFYVWNWFTYHHAVWHLFVLIAAICHYAAVLLALTIKISAS